MAFIKDSDVPVGKREIARAFGLSAQDKVALKRLLADMGDEGLIDSGRGRAFHKMGGVPRVTVLRVVDVADGQVIAVPDHWEAEGVPIPRLRVMERDRRGALGIGDRILARTEERGRGLVAHPMKKLPRASETMLGVLEADGAGKLWLKSIDKRARFDIPVSDAGEAQPGQLVAVERAGRPPRTTARVTEVLGDPLAPKSFSLIAIHKHGIPHVFTDEQIAEAGAVSRLPIVEEAREDLRALPIVAIDPRDARDHDDAIWAEADGQGGWRAIVAIADVSHYVRPGSLIDREARKRGNSVYFPDRVVPMLPHELSSDKCSLKAGEERAALACHLAIDKAGRVTGWRFTRAVVRLAANIAYEDAQGAIDGATGLVPSELVENALKPLWGAWGALKAARDAREPLDLDLPERRVELDEAGRIARVAVRERLDAHRLVEDFMIAANVAAAKALEAKASPVVYRVHEPPAREKLVALKDYLKSFEIEFALGQVIRPATFNRVLERVTDENLRPQVMEQVLRSQTQAYYAPANAGHFGLALGSYAHFTSPIRRYADLLVHRALVRAYGLETAAPKDRAIPKTSALTDSEIAELDRTSEAISKAERRAMEAERETIDRYVAAYLATYVGQVVTARITGVQDFGFFATVDGVGGDGLVPVSHLGDEHFRYDAAAQALIGEASGERYESGRVLELRLAEANPVSGALRFELPEGGSRGQRDRGRPGRPPPRKPQRGRPANIRHQGGKRAKGPRSR